MNDTATQSARTTFLHTSPRAGRLFDFSQDIHPTIVSGWQRSRWQADFGDTHYGFVGSGTATLSCASGTFPLSAGMYFSAVGDAVVEGSGDGFVASFRGSLGLFQIGGPVEQVGRLRYIDGCSDTLLVAPPLAGDPCLNLLHIPAGTDQTAHTHPSLRVGMVLDGEGFCRTSEGDTPMTPGLVFAIRAEGIHSFHTTSRSLRIVAWHPDSDCGPTHESHPMLNRTFVSGRPVNQKEQSR